MPNSLLVVESDQFIRLVLQKRLRNVGYDVGVAPNGVEALALVEKNPPDLVISTWEMPGMDGKELCRQIKTRLDLRATYFILLTSRDQEEDIVAALEAGADEYLIKPVDVKQLVARVKAGLRIVELQKELANTNERLNGALKRIDRELQVVAGIQRALLPQDLPTVEGVRFGAFYRPSSQCGGDYYDVLSLGDGRFGVAMADVSGHGAPAMVAMALTRFLVHTHAAEAQTPAELLSILNRKLFGHLPTEQYVTMFYGILHAKEQTLIYSSAGQTPPLRTQDSSEAIESLPNCEGFPLKLVSPDATYRNTELQGKPGDSFLLYTDGVTEAMNESYDLFGLERLQESLKARAGDPTPDRASSIVRDVDAFAAGYPQADDITLLVIDFV